MPRPGRRDRLTGRESEVLPAMCLFLSLLLFGPRVVIIFWWLIEPARWSLAYDSFILPFLGFLFLPWTTLMYVLVSPGGVDGIRLAVDRARGGRRPGVVRGWGHRRTRARSGVRLEHWLTELIV